MSCIGRGVSCFAFAQRGDIAVLSGGSRAGVATVLSCYILSPLLAQRHRRKVPSRDPNLVFLKIVHEFQTARTTAYDGFFELTFRVTPFKRGFSDIEFQVVPNDVLVPVQQVMAMCPEDFREELATSLWHGLTLPRCGEA